MSVSSLLSVLCSERAEQVTKTYHDIKAVTHLLEEVRSRWCSCDLHVACCCMSPCAAAEGARPWVGRTHRPVPSEAESRTNNTEWNVGWTAGNFKRRGKDWCIINIYTILLVNGLHIVINPSLMVFLFGARLLNFATSCQWEMTFFSSTPALRSLRVLSPSLRELIILTEGRLSSGTVKPFCSVKVHVHLLVFVTYAVGGSSRSLNQALAKRGQAFTQWIAMVSYISLQRNCNSVRLALTIMATMSAMPPGDVTFASHLKALIARLILHSSVQQSLRFQGNPVSNMRHDAQFTCSEENGN